MASTDAAALGQMAVQLIQSGVLAAGSAGVSLLIPPEFDGVEVEADTFQPSVDNGYCAIQVGSGTLASPVWLVGASDYAFQGFYIVQGAMTAELSSGANIRLIGATALAASDNWGKVELRGFNRGSFVRGRNSYITLTNSAGNKTLSQQNAYKASLGAVPTLLRIVPSAGTMKVSYSVWGRRA